MGEPFPGPFTFDYHPWTKDMLCDDSEECVGQKAAQMAFTDSVAINRTFFTIDKLKRDVLYVLPAKTPDATDFSAARFDPALERSPYLSSLFTNVNNVGLKRAGANSLYIRGSRSRSALKSLPVGLIILDEEDEFDQEAITLVRERISGQREGARQIWHISTPSIPGNGVNITFERSTKAHFFFPCPHCNRQIELKFPDSLEVTDNPAHSRYFCTECKATITQEEKIVALRSGIWVAQKDSVIKGYQVNQMYSPVMSAPLFAQSYLLSLTSHVEEQEFHNSKLGEAHVVSGSSVNDTHIQACTIGSKMLAISSEASLTSPQIEIKDAPIITIGVDVGSKLHVEIDAWKMFRNTSIDINDNSIPSVVFAGKVESFDDVANLLYLFRARMTIIDMQPETQMALTLARRYPERVKLCHYTNSPQNLVVFEERVNANRTFWLDRALGRIITGMIKLPMDIPLDWKQEVQRLVRVPGKDRDGNITYSYKKTGDDHFGHARCYAEMALGCVYAGHTEIITERKS